MWSLPILALVLLLSGCALAVGDNSRADVNVNNTPSLDIDQQTPPTKKEK